MNALNLTTLDGGSSGNLYAPAGSVRINNLYDNSIDFYPSGTTSVGTTLYTRGSKSNGTLNVDNAGLSAEERSGAFRVTAVDFEGLVANQLAVQVRRTARLL